MNRALSFAVVALLFIFFTLPLAGMLLWALVFVFGYTPPLWLALVVDGGMLLNLAVLAGRRWHLASRPR